MNEFEGWLKIIQQYQGVQKLVNLNQNLYEQLTGAIFYLKKYADELDLPLKKREELNLMLERSENIMDSINETIDKLSDEDREPHIVRHIAQTPRIHAFHD